MKGLFSHIKPDALKKKDEKDEKAAAEPEIPLLRLLI